MRTTLWTTTRAGLAVTITVAALAFSACATSDDRAEPADERTPVLGEELAGRWAHYDVVAYSDDVMKTLIISYGFTDFTVEDDGLVESDEFCTARQVSDQPIETAISDEGTQAIRPRSTPVEVTEVDGGLRVQRPATPTAVGIRLEDAATDTLPSDPDDPRIVDDDGDGNPGITVKVRIGDELEGELYIARREIFAYDMTTEGPDLLLGTVTDSSEQLVIDATLPALLSSDAQWVQYPDLTKSPIRLERVTDDWDCDRLIAEIDTRFGPDPDIDW